MANLLVRLGIYVIALDVLYLVIAETQFGEKPYARVRQIALAGVALLAAGLLLRVFGRAADKVSVMGAGRCAVCDAKIPKGHKYCYQHARDMEAR